MKSSRDFWLKKFGHFIFGFYLFIFWIKKASSQIPRVSPEPYFVFFLFFLYLTNWAEWFLKHIFDLNAIFFDWFNLNTEDFIILKKKS